MKHEEKVVYDLVDLITTRFDVLTYDVMIFKQLLIAKGVIRESV